MWGLCLLWAISATHLEESGSPLEGFKVHDTNCENNYGLDFKAKLLGGPPY
jgi:hypothetical protein